MEYAISSAMYWRSEEFAEEYAQAILEAGFKLERFKDGGSFYITLNSLKDIEKLSEAVRSSIIFEPTGNLVIYDGYME